MNVKNQDSSFIKKTGSEKLEVLSIKGQSLSFPKHFHESYCITLVLQGIQCTKLGSNTIFTSPNNLSIINPYEVHSSSFLHPNAHFYTIYISPKTIESYSNNLIQFQNDPIYDIDLNSTFIDIIKKIKVNDVISTSKVLNYFIENLIKYKKTINTSPTFTIPWQNASDFINNNLESSIKVSDLATIAGINKYNFAKQFKNTSGMSPMHYILMKRVFEAKKKIKPSTNLSQLAYEYNFVDMSHFSRHFKRFVGLSPKQYQKVLF